MQTHQQPQFEFVPPSHAEKPYTISEINEGIACILESGNTLVWVEGEISNWKPSSSGHCYLRLKDAQSQMPAVMWRSSVSQLDFEPDDGMAVVAIGSIRVYQRGGYYQLDIHKMMPAGTGALHAAFEKLKLKLEKEGLFDQEHKKPLPSSVATLGVITSKRGAALRDIIKVVHSRAPQTDILIMDVAVQGDRAPAEIAKAIQAMNDYGKVDCMIVGRGGESIEDLWAFNEEIVARAIYDSSIPVIAAVGHEIDFTIADFVADVRAPTPSAAAEMAVADTRERKRYFDACASRFGREICGHISSAFSSYHSIVSRSTIRKPARMLLEAVQNKDELRERCMRLMHRLVSKNYEKLHHNGLRLQSLSPLAILQRGYSVVLTEKGCTVKKADQVQPGDTVRLRFSEGEAQASVTASSTAAVKGELDPADAAN